MASADESPLPLIAALQREVDELLALARRETDEIRQRARQEASASVTKERAALAVAEEEAFERAVTDGDSEIARARALRETGLAALRDRLSRRHSEAVAVVVRMVTEDLQ